MDDIEELEDTLVSDEGIRIDAMSSLMESSGANKFITGGGFGRRVWKF